MKTGLFIGRFQPLHNGHMSVINDAMKELDELIIGIGSAEKHDTQENPFSCEERRQMIERTAKGNYRIVPVPDIGDYAKWVNHVENLAGKFDVVYTGNAVVEELFRKKNYEVKQIIENQHISASDIRDMIANGAEWKELVPKETADYIESIGGVRKVKKIIKKFENPLPAVDIIINYEGGIVLIKRKNGQWALPGGFIEYETAESAAVREAKEETGLDVKINKLVGVYSEPSRDPRHVLSVAYAAEGSGQLKAGDDALDAKVFKEIPANLAFDHNKILDDYHAGRKEKRIP